MTTKFRVLLVFSALVGLGAGQTPRVTASEEEAGNTQCWYRVGIDSPSTCWRCYDACMGAGYVCCMGSENVAE